MVRSTGWALHHTSKAVHRLLVLGTGVLVLASCLLAGASWRLAQGPIDLGWLAARVRAALVDDTAAGRVSFDGLVLEWEGFDRGVDHPLDLRISNVSITDPRGRRLATAPDAHLTLSLASLLLGRIVPRTLEVDHGQVAVTREASGSITFGLGPDGDESSAPVSFDLERFRDQLVHPASTDHSPGQSLWDQIRRAHFRDTALTFRDEGTGLTARASGMDLDLVRAGSGRIHGSLEGRLSLNAEQASVAAEVDLVPDADSSVKVRLTSFRPAAVAGLPGSWAFLADLDVPVSMTATIEFNTAFKPDHIQVTVHLGEGRVRIGQGDIPLRSGTIALSGTTDEFVIAQGHLDLAHSSVGAAEIVDVRGNVTRSSNRLTASLTAGLDQIDIADLRRLWPAGVGGGARPWVTEHVASGTATNGMVSLVIEADEALHDIVLTKATGTLDASNASFTWLDNTPPVEAAEVRLTLVDPDTLDIHLVSGRQRVGNHGADLAIRDSDMHITGLSYPDQVAKIHAQVEGRLVSAIALLSEPRLHLLSAHPISLGSLAGDASAGLDVQFPLENDLRIDDIQIHAAARLINVRAVDVAAGQDLDDGALDLDVDKDGLRLKGRGTLATVPITLDGTMDFSLAAPDQIVQKIAVTGRPEAAQLDAAGLHVTGVVRGPIPTTAVLIERRNGDGSVSISSDLTQASLTIAPLAWSKPSGAVASATAILLMSHDRPTKIDHIVVRGDDVAVSGSANFTDGHLQTVLLDNFRLGRSQGHGTIHIAANDEIGVVLQGGQIDLSAKLTEKHSVPSGLRAAPVITPTWRLDARFDEAILANGENASGVLVNAMGVGEMIRTLDAVGATRAGGGFSIKIEPKAEKRHLSVEAKDAGRFLRAIDAVRTMDSGRLTIDGVVDGPAGLQPLAGTAAIDDVVVRNSPVLGKLLQAITLYGLIDVLRGPGITFSHIVVPFHYDGVDLNVDDARAANPSLGLTAKGRIGLSPGKISITGTIVPVYFFNAMLGQLPLVGKLFSPEKGGGVFAARFSLDGPIEDPTISINPVSALTPGFLRDIFGIFDHRGANPAGAAPK